MSAYLLDANVFIQAKNLHYGFDFCPAFWQWLLENHRTGRVFSVESVRDELLALDDELSEWVTKKLPMAFFLRPDATDFESLRRTSEWAARAGYEPGAVRGFLQVADYYLVAQARTRKYAVVTHEVPAASPKKIKVPDACVGMGVECVSPFGMLRRERARFVLPK